VRSDWTQGTGPAIGAPLRTALGASIIFCVLVGSGDANEGDARLLLEGLQSKGCEIRRGAIASYLQSADNQREHNAGLRRLHITDAELRDRVAALMSILDDDRDGAARITTLAEQISTTESLPMADYRLQLPRFRDTLLKLVRSQDEKFTARVGAPWLLIRVLRAGAQDHPDWVPQWRKESLEMLRSRDNNLRVVAAINAGLGRLPEGSDPLASEVVEALISGLQDGSAIVRELSHTGLGQITKSGPCFEATDSKNLRTLAVREWDAWRNANKPKLESQRINQAFW
jgi:hypothetical protein